jgi:hypothetical protein
MTGRANVARQAQQSSEGELLSRLRETAERWASWESTRSRLTSGMLGLDALLKGGWPCGRVAEVVGPASSGRTSIAAATAAAATRRGEVVAWLDITDAFTPPSGEAAGMDLERVLWVRPAGIEEAVRAAELVLETGGFPVIVLDLTPSHPGVRGQGSGVRVPSQPPSFPLRLSRVGDGGTGGWSDPRPPTPNPGRRGGGAALRLRLARAAERAGAVVLVLTDRPWVGTMAGATVMLERGQALWSPRARRAPRWLVGLEVHLRVERGSFGTAGCGVDLRFSWSKPDADGGSDADRLPANTRLSAASTAAC